MITKLQKKLAEIRANEERGMSLTELVVVVAILAILVAIAVPVYLSIQGQAENAAAKTTLSNAVTVYAYTSGTDAQKKTAVEALDNGEAAFFDWDGTNVDCLGITLGGTSASVNVVTGAMFDGNLTCTP